jgi:ferredoxin
MKFITFYFSGTGNTKWIADKFNEIALAAGHENSVHPVFNIDETNINEYQEEIVYSDYIVIANPIYGADIPRRMRLFLALLMNNLGFIHSGHKKLIFINNYGYVNGSGIFHTLRLIKNKPVRIRIYSNIRTSNTATLSKRTKVATGKDLPEAIKAKTVKRLKMVITAAEENKRIIMGTGPHLLGSILMRKLFKERIMNNYMNMHVDSEICTLCMICVKNCPTGSISYNGGDFIFAKSCEACMRCYNRCPVHAISNKK